MSNLYVYEKIIQNTVKIARILKDQDTHVIAMKCDMAEIMKDLHNLAESLLPQESE